MKADKVTYQVRYRGSVYSAHRTEAAAIKAAKQLDNPEELCTVAMIVESGTYKSRRQVWPTEGETYSN